MDNVLVDECEDGHDCMNYRLGSEPSHVANEN